MRGFASVIAAVSAAVYLSGCGSDVTPPAPSPAPTPAPPPLPGLLKGVSQAGAEFGESNLPGVNGTDYIWPSSDSIKHFAQLGFGAVRLPFRWERLQPSKNEDFAVGYWEDLQNTVEIIVQTEQVAILDPHNYARYFGEIIGAPGSSVSIDDFLDFWTRLASHYKDHPKVAFAIMNEPFNMSTSLWADTAQAAINAIRTAGATQLVFVPGNGWTGAHSWTEAWYDTDGNLSNAEAFVDFVDPGNNFAFEMHQYLDESSSGKSPICVSATYGVDGLRQATPWLKDHGFRAFLGEFSAGTDDPCKSGIDEMLNHVDENSEQWLGWAWWAASPWEPDQYYNIEANADGSDKPQVAWIRDHLDPSSTVVA